jgi:hypothetical protein
LIFTVLNSMYSFLSLIIDEKECSHDKSREQSVSLISSK